MVEDFAPRQNLVERYRKPLLGALAVALFFAAWQAIFLVVPFNPLFISKPNLIFEGYVDLVESGDLAHDLAVSAVPFLYGFVAAVVIGVPLGIVMGWRVRVGYALDPLMTVFYASPLVALSPLVVIFFGVGVGGKAVIIFFLSVFPFVFNACAGVRAVDPLHVRLKLRRERLRRILHARPVIDEIANRKPGRQILYAADVIAVVVRDEEAIDVADTHLLRDRRDSIGIAVARAAGVDQERLPCR